MCVSARVNYLEAFVHNMAMQLHSVVWDVLVLLITEVLVQVERLQPVRGHDFRLSVAAAASKRNAVVWVPDFLLPDNSTGRALRRLQEEREKKKRCPGGYKENIFSCLQRKRAAKMIVLP